MTSLSAPLSIITKIVFSSPDAQFTITTGTMGRTTSSKDDTDRNVAVAASHASSLGVMMFESVVVVVVGVDF